MHVKKTFARKVKKKIKNYKANANTLVASVLEVLFV